MASFSVSTKTTIWVLTLALVASAAANSSCGGNPMSNQNEFPCNQYFHVCKRHIEGYEGYLRIPVLQEMNPRQQSVDDRKLFADGDVKITFNRKLSVLHAWEEDHALRTAADKGNKQNFTIFIKDVYRDRMETKANGEKYRMDLTFRSPLLHPNNPEHKTGTDKTIGITSIKFGNFICPTPPVKETPQFPACRVFMIDNSIKDGYRAAAVFTVPSKSNTWTSDIKFPVTIRNFDTPTGNSVRTGENSFRITSLRHNGLQHEGHQFKLEFTVHVNGSNDSERRSKRNKAKQIIRMNFNEYVCEGAIIIRKW